MGGSFPVACPALAASSCLLLSLPLPLAATAPLVVAIGGLRRGAPGVASFEPGVGGRHGGAVCRVRRGKLLEHAVAGVAAALGQRLDLELLQRSVGAQQVPASQAGRQSVRKIGGSVGRRQWDRAAGSSCLAPTITTPPHPPGRCPCLMYSSASSMRTAQQQHQGRGEGSGLQRAHECDAVKHQGREQHVLSSCLLPPLSLTVLLNEVLAVGGNLPGHERRPPAVVAPGAGG